jgi:hypothetical protein
LFIFLSAGQLHLPHLILYNFQLDQLILLMLDQLILLLLDQLFFKFFCRLVYLPIYGSNLPAPSDQLILFNFQLDQLILLLLDQLILYIFQACLSSYLRVNSTCPICRKPLNQLTCTPSNLVLKRSAYIFTPLQHGPRKVSLPFLASSNMGLGRPVYPFYPSPTWSLKGQFTHITPLQPGPKKRSVYAYYHPPN